VETLRLALYVSCTVVPILLVVFQIIGILRRRSSQVLLCMECEQCMAVCPLTRRNGKVMVGPKDIMLASKANREEWAIEHGALLCTSCRLCEKRCPRGLAPYMEVEKWKKRHPREQQRKGPAYAETK
jgi:heterodisulfide reductase subunit C